MVNEVFDMTLLRLSQVAKYLGVSRSTFYRLVESDKSFPKAIELTDQIRVWDQADVSAWIENKKEQHHDRTRTGGQVPAVQGEDQ